MDMGVQETTFLATLFERHSYSSKNKTSAKNSPRYRRRSSTGSTVALELEMRTLNLPDDSQKKILSKITKLKEGINFLEMKLDRRERILECQRKDFIREILILREELYRKKNGREYQTGNFVMRSELSMLKSQIELEEEIMSGSRPSTNVSEQSMKKISGMNNKEVLMKKISLENEKIEFVVKKNRKLDKLRTRGRSVRENMKLLQEKMTEYDKKLDVIELQKEEIRQKEESLTKLEGELFNKEDQLDGSIQRNEDLRHDLKEKLDEYDKITEMAKNKNYRDKEETLMKLEEDISSKASKLAKIKKEIEEKSKEIEEKSKEVDLITLEAIHKRREIETITQEVISKQKDSIAVKEEKMKEFEEKNQELEKRKVELEKIIQSNKVTIDSLAISSTAMSELERQKAIEEEKKRVEQEEKKIQNINNEIETFQKDFKVLFKEIDTVKRRMQFYEQESERRIMKSYMEAPKGVVTLLFTDVECSTELWNEDTKVMKRAMKLHNKVMRQIIDETGGYEVKTEGDCFMVCYDDPIIAVKFAMQVQSRLLTAKWPKKLKDSQLAKVIYNEKSELLFKGLTVRIGINTGKAIKQKDPTTKRADYFGPVVNKAARIEGSACGGATAIPEKVYYKLKEILSDPEKQKEHFGMEVAVKSIGNRNLKGMGREEIRYLFPKHLEGRRFKSPPVDDKSKAKTLEEMLQSLNSRRKNLEQKRCDITTTLARSVKMRTLQDANNEKENVIKYLRGKLTHFKDYFNQTKGKGGNNEFGKFIENEIKVDVNGVMNRYNDLREKQDELQKNFESVEVVFNQKLKRELTNFSCIIDNLKKVVKSSENRNKFERNVWKVEKKVYDGKLLKLKNILKEKEIAIKELEEKVSGMVKLAEVVQVVEKKKEQKEKEKQVLEEKKTKLIDNESRQMVELTTVLDQAIRKISNMSSYTFPRIDWKDDIVVGEETLKDISMFTPESYQYVKNLSKQPHPKMMMTKGPRSPIKKKFVKSVSFKARSPGKRQRTGYDQLPSRIDTSNFRGVGKWDDDEIGEDDRLNFLNSENENERMILSTQNHDNQPIQFVPKHHDGRRGTRRRRRRRTRSTRPPRPHTVHSSRRGWRVKKRASEKERNQRKILKRIIFTKKDNSNIGGESYSRLLQRLPPIKKKPSEKDMHDRISKFRRLNKLAQIDSLSKEKTRLMNKLYYSKNEKRYQYIIPKTGSQ